MFHMKTKTEKVQYLRIMDVNKISFCCPVVLTCSYNLLKQNKHLSTLRLRRMPMPYTLTHHQMSHNNHVSVGIYYL